MTRNYEKVSDEKRQLLIDMIRQNMTIKDAARLIDINYENAKAICRVYRREQRTDKRKERFRYKLTQPKHVGAFAYRSRARKSPASRSSEKSDEEDSDSPGAVRGAGGRHAGAHDSERHGNTTLAGKKSTFRDKHQQNQQSITLGPIAQGVSHGQKQRKTDAFAGQSRTDLASDFKAQSCGVQSKRQRGEVKFLNMASLSEQSPQYMELKNLTIQSEVKEMASLDPEPIKYGEQFFQMLNSSGGGRSKAQVKEEYVQRYSTIHDNYLQQAEEYESLVRQELVRMNAQLNQSIVVSPTVQPQPAAAFQQDIFGRVSSCYRVNSARAAVSRDVSSMSVAASAVQRNSGLVPFEQNGQASKAVENQHLEANTLFPNTQQDVSNSGCPPGRLSQYLAPDYTQWHLQAGLRQKSGEINPALPGVNSLSNHQGANQALSQEMLDFRPPTLTHEQVLSKIGQFVQSKQLQSQEGIANDPMIFSNRTPSNFTNDLNPQMQHTSQRTTPTASIQAGDYTGLSHFHGNNTGGFVMPVHGRPTSHLGQIKESRIYADQEEEKMEQKSHQQFMHAPYQSSYLGAQQSMHGRRPSFPTGLFGGPSRVSAEFRGVDASYYAGGYHPCGPHFGVQNHLAMAQTSALNRAPHHQMMINQRDFGWLGSGNFMGLSHNMHPTSPVEQQQSRQIAADALGLLHSSPQKRLSALQDQDNLDIADLDKTENSRPFGEGWHSSLPAKKLTLPALSGLLQYLDSQQSSSKEKLSGKPQLGFNLENCAATDMIQERVLSREGSQLTEIGIRNKAMGIANQKQTDDATKITPRLPYLGHQLMTQPSKQLSPRHVKEATPTAPQGNFEKLYHANIRAVHDPQVFNANQSDKPPHHQSELCSQYSGRLMQTEDLAALGFPYRFERGDHFSLPDVIAAKKPEIQPRTPDEQQDPNKATETRNKKQSRESSGSNKSDLEEPSLSRDTMQVRRTGQALLPSSDRNSGSKFPFQQSAAASKQSKKQNTHAQPSNSNQASNALVTLKMAPKPDFSIPTEIKHPCLTSSDIVRAQNSLPGPADQPNEGSLGATLPIQADDEGRLRKINTTVFVAKSSNLTTEELAPLPSDTSSSSVSADSDSPNEQLDKASTKPRCTQVSEPHCTNEFSQLRRFQEPQIGAQLSNVNHQILQQQRLIMQARSSNQAIMIGSSEQTAVGPQVPLPRIRGFETTPNVTLESSQARRDNGNAEMTRLGDRFDRSGVNVASFQNDQMQSTFEHDFQPRAAPLAQHPNASAPGAPSADQPTGNTLDNPYDAVKYLMKKLEQIQHKLRMMGFCHNEIQQNRLSHNFHVSLEQEFSAIENLCSGPGSLTKGFFAIGSSGPGVAQHSFEANQKLLQSFTKIMKLMWSELNRFKHVKSQGESTNFGQSMCLQSANLAQQMPTTNTSQFQLPQPQQYPQSSPSCELGTQSQRQAEWPPNTLAHQGTKLAFSGCLESDFFQSIVHANAAQQPVLSASGQPGSMQALARNQTSTAPLQTEDPQATLQQCLRTTSYQLEQIYQQLLTLAPSILKTGQVFIERPGQHCQAPTHASSSQHAPLAPQNNQALTQEHRVRFMAPYYSKNQNSI